MPKTWLEIPNNFSAADKSLTGVIHIATKKGFHLGKMVVELNCFLETRTAPHKRIFHEDVQRSVRYTLHLSESVLFAGKPNMKVSECFHLCPGSHQFPFTLEFPAEPLPPSIIDNSDLRVNHYVRAVIFRKNPPERLLGRSLQACFTTRSSFTYTYPTPIRPLVAPASADTPMSVPEHMGQAKAFTARQRFNLGDTHVYLEIRFDSSIPTFSINEHPTFSVFLVTPHSLARDKGWIELSQLLMDLVSHTTVGAAGTKIQSTNVWLHNGLRLNLANAKPCVDTVDTFGELFEVNIPVARFGEYGKAVAELPVTFKTTHIERSYRLSLLGKVLMQATSVKMDLTSDVVVIGSADINCTNSVHHSDVDIHSLFSFGNASSMTSAEVQPWSPGKLNSLPVYNEADF